MAPLQPDGPALLVGSPGPRDHRHLLSGWHLAEDVSAFPLYFALRARVGCLLALLCLLPFVHYLLSFTTVNSKYSLVFCLSACIQHCVWSLGVVSRSVFAATLQRGHSDFDLKAGSPLPPFLRPRRLPRRVAPPAEDTPSPSELPSVLSWVSRVEGRRYIWASRCFWCLSIRLVLGAVDNLLTHLLETEASWH